MSSRRLLHMTTVAVGEDAANEDGGPGAGPVDDSAVVAKAVAMCVLFAASMTVGCLPLLLSRWFKWDGEEKEKAEWRNNNGKEKRNALVELLLCFGGGVLFCTTFLHLLPEVGEHVEELHEAGTLSGWPEHLAETLMCAGFFAMYLVEEGVNAYLHKREAEGMGALRRSLSVRRGEPPERAPTTVDQGHHGHGHVILDDALMKSIRGLLVVLALSVHELFEGLAVGLESSTAAVWYMFGAVSAHKFVIAFCIGVELTATCTGRLRLVVLYVFTFAVVSPLGIGIGIAVGGAADGGSAAALASALLQGLATGTLFYVVFFEILQNDRKEGLGRCAAVLLGFAVMYAITLAVGHTHSHDDHNHSHLHESVGGGGGGREGGGGGHFSHGLISDLQH